MSLWGQNAGALGCSGSSGFGVFVLRILCFGVCNASYVPFLPHTQWWSLAAVSALPSSPLPPVLTLSGLSSSTLRREGLLALLYPGFQEEV